MQVKYQLYTSSLNKKYIMENKRNKGSEQYNVNGKNKVL